jgi:hypothetical protein
MYTAEETDVHTESWILYLVCERLYGVSDSGRSAYTVFLTDHFGLIHNIMGLSMTVTQMRILIFIKFFVRPYY